nr:sigma-70 family RNA polymerase sigma factor [uncultured Steroidobacter sp.]
MTPQKSRFDVVGQLTALRRYARSLTRDDTNAEDLVHETLLRAYEKRASFLEGRALKPWLLSIMHNVFVDGRRARQAEIERIERASRLQDSVSADTQEQVVRLAQVRRALEELPEDQRAAIHLVAIEELSFAEAAAVLDIPQGTLMSRLARARAALRALDSTTAQRSAPAATRPHLKIVGGADDQSH